HLVERWAETEQLVGRWPGRFAALALVDPERGMRGVRELRARLAEPWVVGCYVHTHSWDRRLDHADYYPFYAACAEAVAQVAALELPPEVEAALLAGTARRVYTRLQQPGGRP